MIGVNSSARVEQLFGVLGGNAVREGDKKIVLGVD